MRAINVFIFILVWFSCNTSSQEKNTNISKTDSLEVNQNNEEQKLVQALQIDSADLLIYEQLMQHAHTLNLENKAISEIVIEVARFFIGTPYVGHTLEKDSVEKLVINLRELDCTTFMESVMALASGIKNKKAGFADYAGMLIKFRYRDGIIDQYPSRLHYTTDWLINNREKGLIELVEGGFGFSDFFPNINFMSTHPKSYRQLANPAFVEIMKQHESRISKERMKYIPKQNLNNTGKIIKDGDIIAILTNVAGLDFSHVGIAAWKNDKLHFIHASSTKKKVVFSEETLYDYLKGSKNSPGIVVARLR